MIKKNAIIHLVNFILGIESITEFNENLTTELRRTRHSKIHYGIIFKIARKNLFVGKIETNKSL